MSNLARQKTGVVLTQPSVSARKPIRLATQTVLAVKDLHKSYRKGALEVPVLKGVSFEIKEGGFTAIIGQSGCGKSTLLHLLGTLDAPDRGEIWFRDQRIDNLRSRKRDRLRNEELGMIFQFYHLLPELTTIENVLIPRMVKDGIFSYWRNRKKYKKQAMELLDRVGMSHRLTHRPCELSGGEMQRTAIARALISNPSLLLADEPTGNLDADNGGDVMDTLLQLNEDDNLTIVMVTHDDSIADKADHVIRLKNGLVEKR